MGERGDQGAVSRATYFERNVPLAVRNIRARDREGLPQLTGDGTYPSLSPLCVVPEVAP